jgi:hypothetical protein
VRAPPAPKANTTNVPPGRHLIKFNDLNLQSKTKETMLTDTHNHPDMAFLERNSRQVPAKSYSNCIV